jgi:hypothetical protein
MKLSKYILRSELFAARFLPKHANAKRQAVRRVEHSLRVPLATYLQWAQLSVEGWLSSVDSRRT